MEQVFANDNDAVLAGDAHEPWLVILNELSARAEIEAVPDLHASADAFDFRTLLLDFATELTVTEVSGRDRAA